MASEVSLSRKVLSVPMTGLVGGLGAGVEAWFLRATRIENFLQRFNPEFKCPSFKEGCFLGVPSAIAKMQSKIIVLIDKGTINYQEKHKKTFEIAKLALEVVTCCSCFFYTKSLGYHNISTPFFTTIVAIGYGKALENIIFPRR